MEFNKIAGAILVTLLTMMVVAKIGNTLVPRFYPHEDKPGAEAPGTAQPESKEPEKPVAELLASADPKRGETRARACTSCHTFEKGGKNGVGPNLWDVIGRKKGGHEGFAYSDGLKGKGGEWTYDDLFAFLGNPSGFAPGSKMAFRLPGAEARADVLAYLRTLSDAPKPLPAAEKKPEAPKPEPGKAEPGKTEPPKADDKPTPPAEEKKN